MRVLGGLAALLAATVMTGTAAPAVASSTPSDLPGTLTTTATEIELGDSVTFEYTLESPSARHWIGIYHEDMAIGTHNAMTWRYVTNGAGTLTWTSGPDDDWRVQTPMTTSGTYVAILFADDGYEPLSEPVHIDITVPAGGDEDASDQERPDPLPETGEDADLSVLTWNIYHGGKDDDSTDLDNRDRVADYIAGYAPDVVLAIETYGAADTILAALNGAVEGRIYEGIRITSSGDDNLWIFTHLPVLEVFDAPRSATISDFNIGGARLQLENNREVAVFDMWSSYTNPWIGDLIEDNAHDVRAGQQPRHDAADVVAADQVQTQMVSEFLNYIDEHTRDDDLVVTGGDLNTVAAEDWIETFATCDSHYGLAYELTATPQFAQAGFTDA